ncbi:hypothetical protein Nstercoris_01733 [Nitrosomonas stercoris]|uniref:Lipoprotein n=1 Tax=Nitrosomonas stercoris TaxID=1444684 RepID=A0A4Y1YSP0_9PROT|nr:hypothetical protein Nstercoris_01733 [Nitrosomonas stercoris]
MMNYNFNLLLLVVVSFFASACVTINIYFPAAAAEKVVDKIIDEVWQIDDDKTDSKDQSGKALKNDDVQDD